MLCGESVQPTLPAFGVFLLALGGGDVCRTGVSDRFQETVGEPSASVRSLADEGRVAAAELPRRTRRLSKAHMDFLKSHAHFVALLLARDFDQAHALALVSTGLRRDDEEQDLQLLDKVVVSTSETRGVLDLLFAPEVSKRTVKGVVGCCGFAANQHFVVCCVSCLQLSIGADDVVFLFRNCRQLLGCWVGRSLDRCGKARRMQRPFPLQLSLPFFIAPLRARKRRDPVPTTLASCHR